MSKTSKRFTGKELLPVLLIALLLASCASAPKSLSQPANEEAAVEFEAVPAASPELLDEDSYARSPNEPAFNDIERIIIKNAGITIVVGDPGETLESISRMTEELDGFVVSANLYQRELDNNLNVSQATATLRVPAQKLNDALNYIRGLSNQDPLSETVESQDITREYVDQKSRLRNLEKTEEQLLKIMEEADETEDVLAVYNELMRVQEQIEITKGQIQYYEQSAAMSLINVEILADEAVQPLTIGSWQPGGVAKSAIQALIDALKFIVDSLIWILIFILPVIFILLLVIGLPLFLVLRVIRRRRKKKKMIENTEPPTSRESN
ncbi:MAG: DUF4349 domain-containing protein [Anaerolineales bacterium]|jgi:PBP1b-binding outer membrane lipoprotein LpoB